MGFKIFSRNGASGMLYDFELEGAQILTELKL